ncbi:hypothetical protein [Streptomyces sp. NPDC014006]|uniref:hypothetical protein n=1 Tax=Streptomyces sp. NPDC014006 TaxID=3364870 RepID=UPI003702739D
MNTERPDNDDAPAGPEEHGAAGERGAARRRSPLAVASVAAAVLLVGGGGAYMAANAAGGSHGAGASGKNGSPTPLALDDYAAGTGPGSTGPGGTNGIAPGEPNPYGVTYRAGGKLPAGPGSAPAYRATGEVSRQDVARLAKALGVDGAPVAEGQTWRVGTGKDGAGPMLQVNRQAPGTWTFTRFAPGTDNCKGTVCAPGPADTSGDPVSVAVAEKAAAPVLKAVGQDDAKLDASQVMGVRRVVNADPEIGGLPTYGWTTGVIVDAQGQVVGGSGMLRTPVKADTYPVLSAERTLALMNAAPGTSTEHRMGIGGCASPMPLKDRLETPCGRSSGAGQREVVTVRKAVFGLATHYSAGRQVLVPSWLFEVRPPGAKADFTVTYPALDPKYLTSARPSTPPSAPPGEPTGRPSPRPTGPASGSAPAPYGVRADGYTAEGRELTVTFTGGVCASYEVKAQESADRVTVTVTAHPGKDKICPMIAKFYHRTVQLKEPLGDRRVVGPDGRGIALVKPGARLPADPR